jgi:hypothetical protein
MPPFDADQASDRPRKAHPPQRVIAGSSAVWQCSICPRLRFSPFEVAYGDAVVIAPGTPTACNLCGDACFS